MTLWLKNIVTSVQSPGAATEWPAAIANRRRMPGAESSRLRCFGRPLESGKRLRQWFSRASRELCTPVTIIPGGSDTDDDPGEKLCHQSTKFAGAWLRVVCGAHRNRWAAGKRTGPDREGGCPWKRLSVDVTPNRRLPPALGSPAAVGPIPQRAPATPGADRQHLATPVHAGGVRGKARHRPAPRDTAWHRLAPRDTAWHRLAPPGTDWHRQRPAPPAVLVAAEHIC